MKALLKSNFFRETLIFAGLLGAALALSFLVQDFALAGSMINPKDNPDVISVATGGETSLRSIVLTILNFFLAFLGLVAVIMVIYGGVLYVTSAGNEENVGKAKKILMYAVVGIVIILLSFALINTILGAGLEGTTTTTTG